MALYVVATPIGNLEDITLRALRLLSEVKLIAAEDTRHTRKLLSAHNIKTPLTSYFEHNRLSKLDYILEVLREGDVALVSDAGMPGISDPGYELIKAAHENGIKVVPVPGASAVITAVAVSGLDSGSFSYLGFLPRQKSERRKALSEVEMLGASIVILEAPHRLQGCLLDIKEVLGDRQISVCRELTKIYEEIFRGSISQSISHFSQPRGEFVLVVEGNRQIPAQPELTGDIISELGLLKKQGKSAKESVALVSQKNGLSKKEIYRAWLKIDKAL
ncbi:16S rRNA (cytidine(1402)-2'-O)-methyltransferase [Dehalococcoides mccartyi]|jgi:16S rRNA (cytidine1402-2'-O)-methyltransferase|uniref:Ribosomal RNA small subunit methyltransferase I n=1 Tax=Dehalococcoides mccartyi TaxID=61435 RepID=A0A142V8R0_9CHLR|nr:16S rRNA (cytidine(1402)-2'-O)-methyltransferase [Dehalococcoides mccartyi]AGG07460.1 tetrapyrrole methylase superfamily protein [Dehalococcoides mccartyi BTF08]AII60492.1 methyltransferase [Dehalococcoides mccartyi CG5]AMU86152.1 tetrapyrrole methylase [Dehalococcoides mccartyi]AQW62029.1 rRNA (cytidine-2'-O-)-methyltransferase [Dehalococcoides mccartyi]AQX73949.1 rRNA (cytidine-2'-O-)-methyltransferase [Dehalococcoides mccartyi]